MQNHQTQINQTQNQWTRNQRAQNERTQIKKMTKNGPEMVSVLTGWTFEMLRFRCKMSYLQLFDRSPSRARWGHMGGSVSDRCGARAGVGGAQRGDSGSARDLKPRGIQLLSHGYARNIYRSSSEYSSLSLNMAICVRQSRFMHNCID